MGNFWHDVMAFIQNVTIDTRVDSLTACLFACLFVFPGMERRVGKGGPRQAQSKCLFIHFIACKCQRVSFLYDMLIFSNFHPIVKSMSYSSKEKLHFVKNTFNLIPVPYIFFSVAYVLAYFHLKIQVML